MKKTYRHSKFTATFTDEDGYFSLTGDMNGGNGAIGNEIVKIDSRFRLINAMHLSDAKTGAPMHAWANAEYFADENRIDSLKRHLRINNKQVNAYITYHSFRKQIRQDHIGWAIFKKGIEDQWQKEADEVREIADSIEANLVGTFVDPFDSQGTYISDEYEMELDSLDEDTINKRIALAMHADADVLSVIGEDHEYVVAGKRYLVLTDDEAEAMWDEDLNSYIDDALEIPDSIRPYFDEEKWKEDARMDGRGPSLGRYDGNEYDEEVNGVTYYIYRQ